MFQARRRAWKLSRFGLVETVVVVSTPRASPTRGELVTFGKESVAAALAGKSRIPLGVGSSVVVYPTLVVDELTDDLAAFVAGYAPRRWCVLEFPVVVEPEAGRTEMLARTPFWGSAYYRTTRQDATELVGLCRETPPSGA